MLHVTEYSVLKTNLQCIFILVDKKLKPYQNSYVYLEYCFTNHVFKGHSQKYRVNTLDE